MRKILAVIMILTSTSVFADPIKLIGIDLSMSVEEQQADLTKSGYECSIKQTMWGTKYRTCLYGKKEINPSSKKLIYNCENFNACDYSLKEFAQAILDQGIVSSLEYNSKMVKSGFDAGKFVLIESYCGRGEGGDKLCVIADKNLLDQVLLTVTIEKGSLGAGGIQFK